MVEIGIDKKYTLLERAKNIMTKPELTGEQMKELQKEYRYIRFIHDPDDPKVFVLQATNEIARGKKPVWEQVKVPEVKGSNRSVVQLYALQVVDLQQY